MNRTVAIMVGVMLMASLMLACTSQQNTAPTTPAAPATPPTAQPATPPPTPPPAPVANASGTSSSATGNVVDQIIGNTSPQDDPGDTSALTDAPTPDAPTS